jgi:dTMP kinase
MAGRLVTLEGPEGAGKSTQLELLREALAAHDPLVVREPGGTQLGESVRELLLHRDGLAISAEAEMYLFMAARSQLLAECIRPALEAGRLVLADRYHDSTVVYQGAVGGVPTTWPPSFPRPDLTILLLVPPELGFRRQAAAGKRPDRMESRPMAFHRQVSDAYRDLAERDPQRFMVLDGTRPSEVLRDEILARVQQLLAGAGR